MDTAKIKWIASDIDGVLTDGQMLIDETGREQKRIFMRDLDAIGVGRRAGLEYVFVTGENNLLAQTIAKRFGVDRLISGAKDKLAALQSFCEQENLDRNQICYVGDSDRDAAAIEWSGLGVAPADGSLDARKAADYIAERSGGKGVLDEVVSWITADRVKKNL